MKAIWRESDLQSNAVIAHKTVFHVFDKAFIRVYAVNGDLFDEPHLFAFVADGNGDLDKFFLYRGKIRIEA